MFERIEKIRIENKLGVNDFIEKSGVSKTSYYSLKDGKTEKLTYKTINKLIETFPNYSYNWIVSGSEEVLKSTNKNFDVEIPEFESLEELGDFVAENYSETKKASSLFRLTVLNDNKDHMIKELTKRGFKVEVNN